MFDKDSNADFISELALHLRFTQSVHREIILCDYCEDDIAFCGCAISNATIVNAFRPLDISLRYPLGGSSADCDCERKKDE